VTVAQAVALVLADWRGVSAQEFNAGAQVCCVRRIVFDLEADTAGTAGDQHRPIASPGRNVG
jgi:hypothetical protein